MTILDKIKRYHDIPMLIKDLRIDKNICISVKSVQFDSIGAAHGTAGNRTEQRLLDAAEIDAEMERLKQERGLLKLEIQQEINFIISGSGAKEAEMRIILKSHLLEGFSLKYISSNTIHRDYGATRKLFHEGFALLEKTSLDLTRSH